MLQASEALHRLREGNRRYVSEVRSRPIVPGRALRRSLAAGQEPFAVILGCSDSRVPVEIVFDQGLGDLFVIRVAGNVVANSQIGSVEFAAERFGTRLVVVLGHSGCGAVRATLEEIESPAANRSPGLLSIVNRIRPAVAGALAREPGDGPEERMRRAVRANVAASVDHLRLGSQILKERSRDRGLLIVGAEYSLETGVVEFS